MPRQCHPDGSTGRRKCSAPRRSGTESDASQLLTALNLASGVCFFCDLQLTAFRSARRCSSCEQVESADVRKWVVSGKGRGGGHLYVFAAAYRGNRYIECLILNSVRSVEPGVG